jgi:hypothetical protein
MIDTTYPLNDDASQAMRNENERRFGSTALPFTVESIV